MTLTAEPPAPPSTQPAELEDVARAVHEEFDDHVEAGLVDQYITEVAARFADARVRAFVPLLVHRYVRDALHGRPAPASSREG